MDRYGTLGNGVRGRGGLPNTFIKKVKTSKTSGMCDFLVTSSRQKSKILLKLNV